MSNMLPGGEYAKTSLQGGGYAKQTTKGGEYAKHTLEGKNMSNMLPGRRIC